VLFKEVNEKPRLADLEIKDFKEEFGMRKIIVFLIALFVVLPLGVKAEVP